MLGSKDIPSKENPSDAFDVQDWGNRGLGRNGTEKAVKLHESPASLAQQAFAPSLANVRELSKAGMKSLSAQEKMREGTNTCFDFLTGFLVAFCRHGAG
jgi:hypothetical protein